MRKTIPRLPGRLVAVLAAFLLLMTAADLRAQERTITGTVTSSADGSPLPGASVVEKGTSNGTVTNADGVYSIAVRPDAVIVVSFIGMGALWVCPID